VKVTARKSGDKQTLTKFNVTIKKKKDSRQESVVTQRDTRALQRRYTRLDERIPLSPTKYALSAAA